MVGGGGLKIMQTAISKDGDDSDVVGGDADFEGDDVAIYLSISCLYALDMIDSSVPMQQNPE